jgi:hypothetical protein
MVLEVGDILAQTRRSRKYVKEWKGFREVKPSAVEGLVPGNVPKLSVNQGTKRQGKFRAQK